MFRSIIKIGISKLQKNSQNTEKYKIRLDGLINSIKGNSSYKRID